MSGAGAQRPCTKGPLQANTSRRRNLNAFGPEAKRRRALLLCLALLALIFPAAAGAQMMPGMEEEKKQDKKEEVAPSKGKPKSIEEKRAALAQKIQDEEPSRAKELYLKYASEYSPYRGLGLAVITLVLLVLVKRYTTRLLRDYAYPKAQKPENVERFFRTWNLLWKIVIGVFVILALFGSLKILGLSAAFMGMMLGWSLQAPVTGIAAWLMILLKRPFRIGDRVIIAGVIGDVMDITLTHVILNQVGGTVGGEEPSGRAVLIPNAILFGNVIMNYTLEEQYMLDEVPVRLTFDSDWELTRKILLDAASEVTEEIVSATQQQPFIRCEFFDAGVLVRLRYQTVPARRQEISSRIVEKVLAGFKENYPAVKFCYPHNVIRYQLEED